MNAMMRRGSRHPLDRRRRPEANRRCWLMLTGLVTSAQGALAAGQDQPLAHVRQEKIGDQVPEWTGEWTDWWANGIASGPREVAASRRAKRLTAAALYDNTWFTNFLAGSPGTLEFQFDLAWIPSGDGSASHGIIAEALQSEPTVVINVPQREHPIFMQ
ncbi:MAG: hypothetical protein GXY58_04615 [Planctomycetaceae bacterium]|mgnify:FL=1|nr:hypothetical protein [Planctomycetaceae bacterium]